MRRSRVLLSVSPAREITSIGKAGFGNTQVMIFCFAPYRFCSIRNTSLCDTNPEFLVFLPRFSFILRI